MRNPVILISGLLFINFNVSEAQSNLINTFDSITNQLITEHCFNGDILISVHDTTLYSKSIGYFNELRRKNEISGNH